MERSPDNRADIRDFLARRRAQLTPEQVGLPTSGRRRVPGLRREEVAVLAGVSTEWYTRLEKGHISGVSEDVLDAVARTLQLSEDERTYLFDLARAARPSAAPRRRRKTTALPPQVQWLLDSMTLSAAYVTNGRLDIVATNALTRALFSPLFDSHTTDQHGRPNFARYWFLDDTSADFADDWDSAATMTTALLRAEAGRYPGDKALRELIGELSTVSAEFRTRWVEPVLVGGVRFGGIDSEGVRFLGGHGQVERLVGEGQGAGGGMVETFDAAVVDAYVAAATRSLETETTSRDS